MLDWFKIFGLIVCGALVGIFFSLLLLYYILKKLAKLAEKLTEQNN